MYRIKKKTGRDDCMIVAFGYSKFVASDNYIKEHNFLHIFLPHFPLFFYPYQV
uniref:Uncharacterized protein n=1 Tax=Rhizophora mucronata TaxID=61149 RepID=A0A2P2P7R7_RHIMU